MPLRTCLPVLAPIPCHNIDCLEIQFLTDDDRCDWSPYIAVDTRRTKRSHHILQVKSTKFSPKQSQNDGFHAENDGTHTKDDEFLTESDEFLLQVLIHRKGFAAKLTDEWMSHERELIAAKRNEELARS